MAMTALGAAPNRADPANFSTRADALLTALPTFVTEANALEANVNAKEASATAQAALATTNGAAQVTLAAGQVTLAEAQVTLAAGQVTLAEAQAIAAQNSALAAAAQASLATSNGAAQVSIAAALANYKGLWSALTGALAMPSSVYHAGKFWALNANLNNVTTATPGVSASWTIVKTGGVDYTLYTNRSTLRALTPSAGDSIVVEGLGLFIWEAASTEPDDDESAFATASGVWLLQAAAWDLVDSWQSVEWDAVAVDDEDEPLRFAASFAASFAAKVIRQTYTNTVSSVGGNTTTSQVVTVANAAVGDSVFITPSGTAVTKPEGVVYGVVTAANTVTVYYVNPHSTTSSNFLTTGLWVVTVIKS